MGLCTERGIGLVVGILGILKAGGAYVPLDPALPADRLAFLLADSGVRVVVAEERTRASLPEFGGEVVAVDDPSPPGPLPHEGRRGSTTDRGWGCQLQAPLPGTGEGGGLRPPGVPYRTRTTSPTSSTPPAPPAPPRASPVTHANVARLFDATGDCFGFGADDVWTLFHSYAFDFSVWEIWGALLHGGRLVVVPREVSRSPEAFLGLLRREGVTVLNQTPSAFHGLVRADEGAPARGRAGAPLRGVRRGGAGACRRCGRGWSGTARSGRGW